MKILVVFNSDPSHPAITGGAFRLLDILTGWQKLFRPKITLVDNKSVLKGKFYDEIRSRKLKITGRFFPYLSKLPYRLRIAYDIIATAIIGLFFTSRQDWIYADFVPATFLPSLIIAKLRGANFCVVCNLLSLGEINWQEKFLRFLTVFANLVIVSNPIYIPLLNNKNTFHGGSIISKKFYEVAHVPKIYDLTFIGSVSDDRKGISIFVKVASKLHKKSVIVTSTKEGTYLEKLLSMANRNLFTIKQNISHEEINLILNQSRIFLFPTKTESYGLVIGEALKAGVPVITSDIPELQFWKDLAILTKDFYKSTALVFKNYRNYEKDLRKKISKSAILNLGYKQVARQEMILLKKFS